MQSDQSEIDAYMYAEHARERDELMHYDLRDVSPIAMYTVL